MRDEFATVAYTNNERVGELGRHWTETDAYGSGATGAAGGFAWITGGQLQFRYLLSNVRDQFAQRQPTPATTVRQLDRQLDGDRTMARRAAG